MSTGSTDSYPIPSDILKARRERAESSWQKSDAVVLVGSGEPIPIPGGADQTFPFRVHPHFQWLTGLRTPGSVVAFDPDEGWIEFLHRTTVAERVWEGAEEIDRGRDRNDLASWLASRAGRPTVWLGAGTPADGYDNELSARLDGQLLHARRRKDRAEIAMIRKAIAATAAGFAILPEILRSGISERKAQIELERAMYAAGGERTAYDTIIGFGSNAAVLHFPPSGRRAAEGEIVLVDAGADIGGYVADVTRMFPVDGAFTSEAREIHDALLAVQERAIAGCTAGVEWRTVHERTARDLAEALIALGIIRCGLDEAVENETIALFLPHGIGHMVGLGVRDAGGVLDGRPSPARCCGITLRVDLPLEEGYVMTVEPGVYFIPALLNDPENREKHRDAVDWERAERLTALGGMRIEDDVLITDGSPDVLTAAIPKQ